jgi:hypothetical protein
MTNPTDKRLRLLTSIDVAIAGIETEIKKATHGLEAVDGLPQLTIIRSKLRELGAILIDDDWKSIPKSKPGMARLVVDTWPLSDPLGERISEIEYEYERLLSAIQF